MKVLLTGGTGMVGSLVLKHCLDHAEVKEVTSFVRRDSKQSHPKLNEIVLTDFEDYSSQTENFQDVGTAYFCLGVYTGQVPDDLFKKITVDYAVNFAKMVEQESPGTKFCLLSGAGADQTEKSRTSFAKFKGMAENQIGAMDLDFYSLRPGYIYPVTPREEPNMMYTISRALYPVLKLFGRNMSIRSTELAEGIFKAGMQGAPKSILENGEILDLLES